MQRTAAAGTVSPVERRSKLAPISAPASRYRLGVRFSRQRRQPNRRISNGLRVEGTTTILEMGIHNSNLNPETGLTVAGYAIRTLRAGWHHFKATIDPTQIVFELDFGADGVTDATRLITTTNTSSIAWNSLRIGGPSDLSSPLGGAGFDNVNIRIVPEPVAFPLFAAGALALLRRSRNHRAGPSMRRRQAA